ncbi:MAG: TetR/AcrR family transcriptional regulator [Propionicimonas sp.]|nr:TetR/AcrR family transcriptional regulator [Propionicimonas sp.]
MATTRQTAAAREAILEAAADLVRTHGVVGMSIADLIARSGTSAGAIYHHFGSKQAVVLEVTRRAVAVPMASVMSTPTSAGLSPAHLLEAAITRVVHDETTADLVVQVWAGASSDPELHEVLHSEGLGIQAAVATVVSDWCAQHEVDADPEGLASVLIGLVMGYAVQRALLPGTDREAYVATGQQLLNSVLPNAAD